ncbi:MAG TPA: caspase family protein, partial [Spirochaetota bacterium]|nr:caspase family protein [Spirochaetota bacterium]
SEIKQNKIGNKSVEIDLSLSDSKYKIKSYNVYVNDVPLYGTYGKDISNLGNNGLQPLVLNETIELTSGANKIEVSCINIKGVESLRDTISVEYKNETVNTKSDLYYLGFGVSKYKDNSLNLKYADKDAKDLALLFEKMKLNYGKIYTKTFVNEECTVENIKKAKSFLKNANPDDTFILFIAGHGVHDKDKDETYYFLTHEADINNLSKSAANFELVEDIMQNISPRKKLFLMDTCESGEIDDDIQTDFFAMANLKGMNSRAINQERGLKKKDGKDKSETKRNYLLDRDRYIYNDLVRRSGAIVFSSSRGGEFSYESDTIGNGFFTYEIMNALKGKAKLDKGVVSIDNLKDYVKSSVALLADGKQNPTVDRDNIYQKFGLPVVSVGMEIFSNTTDNPDEKPVIDANLSHPNVVKVSFSPDGKLLASGSKDGSTKIWKTSTGKEIITLSEKKSEVVDMKFTPDNKSILTFYYAPSNYRNDFTKDTHKLWDISSGKSIKTYSLQYYDFKKDISPNNQYMATASDKQIMILNLSNGLTVAKFDLQEGGDKLKNLTFSNDSKLLYYVNEI